MTSPPILTYIILLPLAASFCLLALIKQETAARVVALGAAVVELLLTCWAWWVLRRSSGGRAGRFFPL